MKTCRDCGESKPLTEFHWDSRSSDGYYSYCKPCKNARTRTRALVYKKLSVDVSAIGTKFCSRCQEDKPLTEFGRRNSTPDGFCWCCKSCFNAKAKEYPSHPSHRNREVINPYTRQSRSTAAILRAEYHQKRKHDPGYRRIRAKSNAASKRRRKARRRGGKCIPYTPSQIQAKIAYWGHRCWICTIQLSGSIHMDHVKPIAKGGMDCLANLRPVCPTCNSRKNARWPYIQDPASS